MTRINPDLSVANLIQEPETVVQKTPQNVNVYNQDSFTAGAVKKTSQKNQPLETTTFVLSGGPQGEGVQKVGFRSHLARMALMSGVSGYAYNNTNPPNVHFVVQGTPESMKQISAYLDGMIQQPEKYDMGSHRIHLQTLSMTDQAPSQPVKPGVFTVYNWTSSSRDWTIPVTIHIPVHTGKPMSYNDAKNTWNSIMKESETGINT